MFATLQDYVSASGGSDGGGATDAQIVLALLYLLKCCMVLVFFVASTVVRRGDTFHRMFCPHQKARERRATARSGGGSSGSGSGGSGLSAARGKQRAIGKAPVPLSTVDSFQFNLAATGYLYLVLLLWDGELALSFHHFLDANYGPVFLIYLLSVAKVAAAATAHGCLLPRAIPPRSSA